jgi:hypothetical protein
VAPAEPTVVAAPERIPDDPPPPPPLPPLPAVLVPDAAVDALVLDAAEVCEFVPVAVGEPVMFGNDATPEPEGKPPRIETPPTSPIAGAPTCAIAGQAMQRPAMEA